MDQPVIPQDIITWALIIVSILLVAGITYTYTNRNKFLTLIFTLITIFTIAFIKLIGLVNIKLKSSFLGGYNENNIGYVMSEPGWKLLLQGWHIWILPVILVSVLAFVIIISIVLYKFSGGEKVEVLTRTSPIASTPKVTSADRLNTFMAIDAARKSSQETQEKLAEALLKNASYEIQLSDVNLKLREVTRELDEKTKQLQDEIDVLELELKAKTKENEYIIDQLSERSRELKRAQEMFEQLMALHKGGKPT